MKRQNKKPKKKPSRIKKEIKEIVKDAGDLFEAIEDEIFHYHPKGRRPQAKRIIQKITFLNQKFKGRIMAQTMNVGQFETVDLTGLDKNEQPAPINSGAFASSDPNIILVDITGDLSAKITGVSAGTATLTYSAKSANGTQLPDQTEEFTITQAEEQATHIQATFSAPQNQ